PRAIADALVSENREMFQAGVAAAVVFSSGSVKRARDPFSVPDTRIDVADLLRRLVPSGYSAKERAEALVKIAPALSTAAVAAAQSSQNRAQAVAEALLARRGAPAYGALTTGLSEQAPALVKSAEAAAEAIAKAVTPAYVVLSTHPTTETRVLAVRLLGTRSEGVARSAVLAALEDREDSVRTAALEAVVAARPPGATEAVIKLLAPSESWPIRLRAARALAAVATAQSDRDKAATALTTAASKDSVALVREAAVKALFEVSKERARATLQQVAEKDAEARVRQTANKLLQGGTAP
nr:HEAT repeat domain-containing protein [Polyangiaceae bacterium]